MVSWTFVDVAGKPVVKARVTVRLWAIYLPPIESAFEYSFETDADGQIPPMGAVPPKVEFVARKGLLYASGSLLAKDIKPDNVFVMQTNLVDHAGNTISNGINSFLGNGEKDKPLSQTLKDNAITVTLLVISGVIILVVVKCLWSTISRAASKAKNTVRSYLST